MAEPRRPKRLCIGVVSRQSNPSAHLTQRNHLEPEPLRIAAKHIIQRRHALGTCGLGTCKVHGVAGAQRARGVRHQLGLR